MGSPELSIAKKSEALQQHTIIKSSDPAVVNPVGTLCYLSSTHLWFFNHSCSGQFQIRSDFTCLGSILPQEGTTLLSTLWPVGPLSKLSLKVLQESIGATTNRDCNHCSQVLLTLVLKQITLGYLMFASQEILTKWAPTGHGRDLFP